MSLEKKTKIRKQLPSANQFSHIVPTEVTIVVRHIMRLTWKTFVQSQAAVSWRLAGSWKQQDYHSLWIFKRSVTPMLLPNKTQMRAAAISPIINIFGKYLHPQFAYCH